MQRVSVSRRDKPGDQALSSLLEPWTYQAEESRETPQIEWERLSETEKRKIDAKQGSNKE